MIISTHLSPGGGHQVGLGQPLLVRLVTRIFEQFRMLDVQAAAGLTKAKSLENIKQSYQTEILIIQDAVFKGSDCMTLILML